LENKESKMSQPNDPQNPPQNPTTALGRGLDSLFGTTQISANTIDKREGLSTLPLNLLKAGKFQPRQVFKEEDLSDLESSIKSNGILQPILVRRLTEKDKFDNDLYEIVAGERRWRAAERAGLKRVPVIIKEMSDQQALESALIENIQRNDLNPLEEAKGYQRLIEQFQYTQEKLSQMIGKSRSHIANMMRLLAAPTEVQDALHDGRISAGHARQLLNNPNYKDLLHQITSGNLSVRDAEARNAKNRKTRAPRGGQTIDLPVEFYEDIKMIQADLQKVFDLPIRIELNPEKNGYRSGLIKISFDNIAQLNGLMNKLFKTL
jgi:ParB family chromosome partitioning protein